MYKKIIAVLAISIAMSEAQAQSSVTLSGIIDGGLSFTNGVGAPDKNLRITHKLADHAIRFA